MTKRKSKKAPARKKRLVAKKKLNPMFRSLDEIATGKIDPQRLVDERMNILEGELAGLKAQYDEIHRAGSDIRATIARQEEQYSAIQLEKIRKQLVGYLSPAQLEAAETTKVTPLFYVLQWIHIHYERLFAHDAVYNDHPGVLINSWEN